MAPRMPVPCWAAPISGRVPRTASSLRWWPPCRPPSPRKANGIAVCLIDPKAFNKPTTDALSIGIPVIGYNADTTGNARLAYVGQSLYQSGYNIAQRWLKLVKKGSLVMLSIGTPGSLNLQPRINGYIQAIKDAGNPVKYVVVDTRRDPRLATHALRVGGWPIRIRTWAACSVAAVATPSPWATSPRNMVWPRRASSRVPMIWSQRLCHILPAAMRPLPPISSPTCRGSSLSCRCICTICPRLRLLHSTPIPACLCHQGQRQDYTSLQEPLRR